MKTALTILLLCLCLATVSLKSQTAPVTAAGLITNATTVPGATIVPITVKYFTGIGYFNLTLRYKASLDETHLLDLTFTYRASTAALTWITSGTNCEYKKYDNGAYILLNDSPETSYYINGAISNRAAPVTYAPVILNPAAGNITLPVTVDNFSAIAAITLNLEYDQAVLTYLDCVPNPNLGGGFAAAASMGPNGKMQLIISCYGTDTLLTLTNGSALFTLSFNYSNTTGTWSGLDWLESGTSCDYADSKANPLIDSPTATYYHNGLI
jgi:hypothetical protein